MGDAPGQAGPTLCHETGQWGARGLACPPPPPPQAQGCSPSLGVFLGCGHPLSHSGSWGGHPVLGLGLPLLERSPSIRDYPLSMPCLRHKW